MNNEYIKHIKKCWDFSETTVEKELKINGVAATNIKIKIFEKILTPLHYFQQENTDQEPKPTDKQMKLAKKLGIKNPENYTKKSISEKINEVLQND